MTACTDDTGSEPNYSVCEHIVAAVDTVADDDQCCSYTSVAAGRTQHCLSYTSAAVYNCHIVAAVDTVADDDQCCSYTSVAVGKTQHCLSCTNLEGTTHCCTSKDCRRIAELKAAG